MKMPKFKVLIKQQVKSSWMTSMAGKWCNWLVTWQ